MAHKLLEVKYCKQTCSSGLAILIVLRVALYATGEAPSLKIRKLPGNYPNTNEYSWTLFCL